MTKCRVGAPREKGNVMPSPGLCLLWGVAFIIVCAVIYGFKWLATLPWWAIAIVVIAIGVICSVRAEEDADQALMGIVLTIVGTLMLIVSCFLINGVLGVVVLLLAAAGVSYIVNSQS